LLSPAVLAATGLSLPLILGKKFCFRAGLVPWQSRNAWLISKSGARLRAANHGIVTGIGG
jgi:hypothetical protein